MAYMPYTKIRMERTHMNPFVVIFYELSNGRCPVEEFLSSIDTSMRAKAVGLLQILQEHGCQLREPYTKPLGDGIFELRVQSGNNISRILYFFYAGGKIIVTNGFVKKTQRTPVQEITLAKKYRQDYCERMVKS